MDLTIPYVPSLPERLETMFSLINVAPGQKSVDLGSGDGRVVIEFAKKGLEAYGYEERADLVELAEMNIKKEKLEGRAFVFNKDFWQIDLSEFDVVTIYGITGVMAKLEEKLEKELKPGAIFVSNGFRLPHWEPVAKFNFIYVYKKE